jgi:DNA-binding CsgD family transcriptional regulator
MKLDWCASAGSIVDLIGADGFPAALADALRQLIGFEFTVMFGYVGSARPLDLYNDFPPDRYRLHVAEYQEGPYLLDPFFLATLGAVAPGIWRLSDIAPDRFYQGEYFRSYYAQTGLSEEVGFLIDVHANLTVVISLMRTERRFSNNEMRTLEDIWPLVDATARRHWGDMPVMAGETASDIEATIEQAFQTIGNGLLTPRERQVVEHTLKGHSAEAVGKILGISPGTVRIHRRNIYSKLRISSQGELFSEFLASMLGAQDRRVVG